MFVVVVVAVFLVVVVAVFAVAVVAAVVALLLLLLLLVVFLLLFLLLLLVNNNNNNNNNNLVESENAQGVFFIVCQLWDVQNLKTIKKRLAKNVLTFQAVDRFFIVFRFCQILKTINKRSYKLSENV